MMTETLDALVNFFGDHPNLALLIAFVISAGEALFIVGLFVPSTVVLVGVGALVGMGKLSFAPIFLATMFGAVVGDAVSYWVGHRWKEQIREFWPFNRYTSLLDKGEAFFAEHGGKSVFIGRFIPGIKAVVPAVAGIVGMDPVRFTVINVISAAVWAAVHLFPAIGIGRSIDVAQSSDPRLLMLLLIITMTAVLTWCGAKLAIGFLLPIAERGRFALADRLAASSSGTAVWASRLLANEGGVLVPYVYAVLALSALSGFIMLIVKSLFDPQLARSDVAISGYLQALRTDLVDKMMIAVTMLGDGVVLTAIALSLTVTLLMLCRWRLACSIAAAFLMASVFTPVLEALLPTASLETRPLYQAVEAFGFPSGHAALSAAVLGVTVLLLVHPYSDPVRRFAYLATTVVIALIGISRIYLQAHWPSSVLAGVLFGGSLVFAMAMLIHGRPLRLPFRFLACVVGATLLVAYPAHLYSNYAAAGQRYVRTATPVILDRRQWGETGWRQLPAARVLLDGDTGEPILAQTDLPLEDLVEDLEAAGWRRETNSRLDELLGAVLPSKGGLAHHPPRPLTNNGGAPLATLTRPVEKESQSRFVLRVWGTNFLVGNGRQTPISALSMTAETLNPIAFGWSLVEQARLDKDDVKNAVAELATALRRSHRLPGVKQDSKLPMILSDTRETGDIYAK